MTNRRRQGARIRCRTAGYSAHGCSTRRRAGGDRRACRIRLAAAWGSRGACRRTRREHAPDAGNEPRRGDQRRRAGAEKLWAGTVTIHPDAKTGAHHHGPLESVIYVVSGRARMRWGERLEFMAEAGPGDFIYVPPFVPHQEINASPDAPLSCVVVRSGQEAGRRQPRPARRRAQSRTGPLGRRHPPGALSARYDERDGARRPARPGPAPTGGSRGSRERPRRR